MATAVITFGANLSQNGNPPEKTLKNALEALSTFANVDVGTSSRWYVTPAFQVDSEMPDFVNGAVLAKTSLAPEAMLAALHEIEGRFGRTRAARWAARPVDLDLIAVDGAVLPDRETQTRWRTMAPDEACTAWPDTLILPHPRMAERAFVLKPMADIWPDWRHPLTGMTVRDMLARLDPAEAAAVRPLTRGA